MNATIAASKETAPPGDSSVLDIPLERIRESTTNPRRVFDETKLREFADNIRLLCLLIDTIITLISVF